ncbi:hypothetical protein GCM10010960_01380 [Arenimonas maotaiensis]|uniref:DUF2884 family protein n=1 Tax=Arenimonas maotaiensis TaxID=1446479 RepID=A0A917CER9_9GAMM|nr:hypothetical protein [Arenimonas maotaiensis]GGF82994.1 hypothetical protein GCM10010960_01380 [Arenimonas maotaiensis]
MKTTLTALLLSTLLLTGCLPEADIEQSLADAHAEIDQAARLIAEENMQLQADGQPDAEITPEGDLLIGGKAVALSAGQRTLLAAHRNQLVGIATEGVQIGRQGVDLAGRAMKSALFAVLTGNEARFERKMEAEAAKIEASAITLCDRLPALLASQSAVSDAVPEFKPYARVEQSDIAECARDVAEAKAKVFAAKASPSR